MALQVIPSDGSFSGLSYLLVPPVTLGNPLFVSLAFQPPVVQDTWPAYEVFCWDNQAKNDTMEQSFELLVRLAEWKPSPGEEFPHPALCHIFIFKITEGMTKSP